MAVLCLPGRQLPHPASGPPARLGSQRECLVRRLILFPLRLWILQLWILQPQVRARLLLVGGSTRAPALARRPPFALCHDQ